jgi:hypothetical protein
LLKKTIPISLKIVPGGVSLPLDTMENYSWLRFVFWEVLPCKIIVDRRFRGEIMEAARTSETSANNYFTLQYIPEDKSELHTRRRENLKYHILSSMEKKVGSPWNKA